MLIIKKVFDTVIIDEAAQAVEVSTLIPLYYKCKRLILIGDPKQLPATIFSKICEKYNYSQSLFQRLMLSNVEVNMLEVMIYFCFLSIKYFYNFIIFLDLIQNAPKNF